MGWVRRVVVWMAWCAAITASLNFLLIIRAPSSSILHQRHHRTPTPSDTLTHDEHGITERVYLKGEVYALRDSNYLRERSQSRHGLVMISVLYQHFSAVRAQYLSFSPGLKEFLAELKGTIIKRGITDDPWELARKWAKPYMLVPERARGLGDILAALHSAPIIRADVGYKGTQLKLSLLLKGRQKVIFKPCWYARGDVIEGKVYAGADRHNGEIAAFHLSLLLGLTAVPITVGRRISLRRQILPFASRKLASTFYTKGRSICFYGVCYYCHKNASVCDDGHLLEGVVILWLPSRLPLTHLPHPWARTYKKNKLAEWEEDDQYCSRVVHHPLFSSPVSSRLLDLMDTAVFDFLIQNGDRHHYTVVAGHENSSVILLDNGKSFGDPYVDHLDILAPVLQCCRLRQSTYERLILLSGGGLSSSLKQLLRLDPIAPILTEPHFRALDRRLLFILAALQMCKQKKGGWHNTLF